MPEEHASDGAGFEIPEEFGVTGVFVFLRACERFAIDPRSIDMDDPEVAYLIAYDHVRTVQESRRV